MLKQEKKLQQSEAITLISSCLLGLFCPPIVRNFRRIFVECNFANFPSIVSIVVMTILLYFFFHYPRCDRNIPNRL